MIPSTTSYEAHSLRHVEDMHLLVKNISAVE
jgi:hypothetical protein